MSQSLEIKRKLFSSEKPPALKEIEDPARFNELCQKIMGRVLFVAPNVLKAPSNILEKISLKEPLEFVIFSSPEERKRLWQESIIEEGVSERMNPDTYFCFSIAATDEERGKELERRASQFVATPLNESTIGIHQPSIMKEITTNTFQEGKGYCENEIAELCREVILLNTIAHDWTHLIQLKIKGSVPPEMQRILSGEILAILDEGRSRVEAYRERLSEDEREIFNQEVAWLKKALQQNSEKGVSEITYQARGTLLFLKGTDEEADAFLKAGYDLEEDFSDYLTTAIVDAYLGRFEPWFSKKAIQEIATIMASYDPEKFRVFERLFRGQTLLIRSILCGTFYSQLWEIMPEDKKSDFCSALLRSGLQSGEKDRLYDIASELPQIKALTQKRRPLRRRRRKRK